MFRHNNSISLFSCLFKSFFQVIQEFGEEIQTGLFFHFVNTDGKYLQWLIGRTVGDDKTDHFLRWSQVIS